MNCEDLDEDTEPQMTRAGIFLRDRNGVTKNPPPKIRRRQVRSGEFRIKQDFEVVSEEALNFSALAEESWSAWEELISQVAAESAVAENSAERLTIAFWIPRAGGRIILHWPGWSRWLPLVDSVWMERERRRSLETVDVVRLAFAREGGVELRSVKIVTRDPSERQMQMVNFVNAALADATVRTESAWFVVGLDAVYGVAGLVMENRELAALAEAGISIEVIGIDGLRS